MRPQDDEIPCNARYKCAFFFGVICLLIIFVFLFKIISDQFSASRFWVHFSRLTQFALAWSTVCGAWFHMTTSEGASN